MPAPLVATILDSLNREVLNQLDLAGSVAHPAENGRAREQILAGFLARLIPDGFGISTGFVIDALGQISRQIDLVVYRTDYHPVLQIGGIRYFLVESVAAVIENKASIDSTHDLEAALENIKSVKALDRTNGGSNYVVVGGRQGPSVDPATFFHQVFGAIVTEKSLTTPSLQGALFDFFRTAPDRRLWPNLYVDVRHCSARYVNC